MEIPAEQLEMLSTKIATAAAIARRLPSGGRHDFAMSLAGYMLRAGRMDEETTLEILLAAWLAAGADAPEALDDLRRIVRDTTKKLSSGAPVTGGPTLGGIVPGLAPLLANWWGWDAEDDQDGEEMEDDAKVPTHDELRDRWLAKQTSPVAFALGSWRRYLAGSGYWDKVHDLIVYRSHLINGKEGDRSYFASTAGGVFSLFSRADAF